MGILSYLKIGGGLVLALALSFGALWVKGRFDRAAEADRVEAQAARDVADAGAKVDIAKAQIVADRQALAEAETARAAADEIIRKREDANANLLALLRARAKAVSASAADCSYRPGARGLLVLAWGGHAPAETPAVPDTPR